MALELEALGELLDKLTYVRLRKKIKSEWLDKQLDEAIIRVVDNVAHKVVADLITKSSGSTEAYIAQHVVKRMSRPNLNAMIDAAIAKASDAMGASLQPIIEARIGEVIKDIIKREVDGRLREVSRHTVDTLVGESMCSNYSTIRDLADQLSDSDEESEDAST